MCAGEQLIKQIASVQVGAEQMDARAIGGSLQRTEERVIARAGLHVFRQEKRNDDRSERDDADKPQRDHRHAIALQHLPAVRLRA